MQATASAADLSDSMFGGTLDFIDLRRTTWIYNDLNGFMWIEVSGNLLLEPLGVPGSLVLKPLGSLGLAVDLGAYSQGGASSLLAGKRF